MTTEIHDEKILVADVGGTSTRFAIAERQSNSPDQRPTIGHFWKTFGDDHAGFSQALSSYLEITGHPTPDKMIVGVAGPVLNNRAQLTNRDWTIDGTELKREHNFQSVSVINDFAAMARAAPLLLDEETRLIAPGHTVPDMPVVVCGPGTGLGLASLKPLKNGDWIVLGGEGGHQAFSPRDDLEIELLKRLTPLQGYVSNESVCSGKYFPEVLNAIQEIYGQPNVPLSPAELAQKAVEGDKMAGDFCQLRAHVAMTALGDAVLAGAARGGAYLAGGVANLLVDYFKTESAISRFRERGPMSKLMTDIPIRLITSNEAPMMGAAAYRD